VKEIKEMPRQKYRGGSARRCSTSLRAGPEANVDSVPERSLFALTFSSSTLAIPTDLGWDTFPVNLDFALVTDVRLMPETFVAYDVGITSHITRSSEASSTNTCDLGLVSSRADCIAVRLSCFSQIKRSIDFLPSSSIESSYSLNPRRFFKF